MTKPEIIPFNRARADEDGLRYVHEAVAGGHTSGDGPFTKKCEGLLQRELGLARALLTTSGTHALEMCAMLLDLVPGDEVVVPSFTFVSTAGAFVSRGAVPVFADVRPDTLNLDEGLLEAKITPRTRAVVAVHYAGVACEMDAILEIAKARGIPVVEDNAHGLFGKYQGRPLGALGTLGAQSFHETKNFQCGEGGCLNLAGPEFAERAEIIREKGTDRKKFMRGEVDKYTWVDAGSSYVPADILAAYLWAQLEKWPAIQVRRRAVWHRYREGLGGWARSRGVGLPCVPAHCEQSYQEFHLLLPTHAQRQSFIRHLKKRAIASAFHYLPLHASAMGARLGWKPGDCPVSEDVAGRLVRLPFFNDLSGADQDRVVESALEWKP